MAEGGLTVLDGTALRSLAVSPIELNGVITGANLLEIADTKASQSLFGIQLPQNIKNSALARVVGCDYDSTFRRTELTAKQASKTFSDYLSTIADQLKESSPRASGPSSGDEWRSTFDAAAANGLVDSSRYGSNGHSRWNSDSPQNGDVVSGANSGSRRTLNRLPSTPPQGGSSYRY
ncbi:hypothetical protein SLA2020_209000 [Shorea laevis]